MFACKNSKEAKYILFCRMFWLFKKKFYDLVIIAILTDINCFRGVSFAPQLINIIVYINIYIINNLCEICIYILDLSCPKISIEINK